MAYGFLRVSLSGSNVDFVDYTDTIQNNRAVAVNGNAIWLPVRYLISNRILAAYWLMVMHIHDYGGYCGVIGVYFLSLIFGFTTYVELFKQYDSELFI